MPASCERCAALSSRPARSAQRAATARKGMEDQLDNPYAHRGARLRGVQPDAIRIVASLSVAMGVAWAVASRGRRPHPLRAREGHARGKSVPQPPQSIAGAGANRRGGSIPFFLPLCYAALHDHLDEGLSEVLLELSHQRLHLAAHIILGAKGAPSQTFEPAVQQVVWVQLTLWSCTSSAASSKPGTRCASTVAEPSSWVLT